MSNKVKEFGVAAKAVVFNDQGDYLVLRKSSSEDINPNTYDLPGGRVEFGEKLDEAVIREVKEETGLVIKPLQIFNAWTFIKDSNFQLTGIDFIARLVEGGEKLSSEHDEVLWINSKDIQKRSDFPEWLSKTIKKAEIIRCALFLK